MTNRLTDDQREQIKANFVAGIKPKESAELVGCARTSVDNVLVAAGLKARNPLVGVTITNALEDYKPGDQFWIERIRCELYFGNMPDGLTMEFADGHTAEMMGARLRRDDGFEMQLLGPSRHRWV